MVTAFVHGIFWKETLDLDDVEDCHALWETDIDEYKESVKNFVDIGPRNDFWLVWCHAISLTNVKLL